MVLKCFQIYFIILAIKSNHNHHLYRIIATLLIREKKKKKCNLISRTVLTRITLPRHKTFPSRDIIIVRDNRTVIHGAKRFFRVHVHNIIRTR